MFKYRGSLDGGGRRLKLLQAIDSITVAVGDAVISDYANNTNKVDLATASSSILGINAGICDKYGNPQITTTVSAGTAASTNVTSKATGTDGATYILIDINQKSLYSASLDATVGTTTGSNKRGCWFILADANDIDESSIISAFNPQTTDNLVQFYSHGLDPRDSGRIIVNQVASEMGNNPTV